VRAVRQTRAQGLTASGGSTPAAGLPISYWFASCATSCTSPSAWSDVPVGGTFDMEKAPIARGHFLGDYEGIATNGRDFLLLHAVAGTSARSADVRFTRLTP